MLKKAAMITPLVCELLFCVILGITQKGVCKKGKSAMNLSNLGKFCQIWPRAIYLC